MGDPLGRMCFLGLLVFQNISFETRLRKVLCSASLGCISTHVISRCLQVQDLKHNCIRLYEVAFEVVGM